MLFFSNKDTARVKNVAIVIDKSRKKSLRFVFYLSKTYFCPVYAIPTLREGRH